MRRAARLTTLPIMEYSERLPFPMEPQNTSPVVRPMAQRCPSAFRAVLIASAADRQGPAALGFRV